ncbi:MAG: homocysteine S-methyltransferase family protein, partial [Lachnospiraceae bacterium]|nr:homocysteine S-methyltransferase family protein [Lachnospiraceae bacterium]
MKITEYLMDHRLITDGAFGTYYQKKFGDEYYVVEKANTEAPDRVKEIHLEYIAAGAGLIRTNTFASNTMFFDSLQEVVNNVEAGYAIAKKAVEESKKEVFIAADLGPIYDSDNEEYESVLAEYKTICDTFFACGARIFLFETLSDLNYVAPLAEYIKEKGETFVIAQFSFDKSGYTKSGISVRRMIERVAQEKALDAFGFNCGVEPAHLYHILKEVTFPEGKFVTALPNAGYPVFLRGKTIYSNNEAYFVKMQEKIADLGIDILGGCCGTEPSYI